LLPTGCRGLRFSKVRVAVIPVILVAIYTALVTSFYHTEVRRHLTAPAPSADGTSVTIDFNEIQPNSGLLKGVVKILPGPALLDPLTRGLTEDLGVAITSTVTSQASPAKRTWSKGAVPSVFPITLDLSGDPGYWPFDHYESGPITVVLFHGPAQVPERVPVTFIDDVPSWYPTVPDASRADSVAVYQVQLTRTAGALLFACVLVGVLIALAALAAFVAVQTVRGRRRFQPPMTTWYAAMLFAVVPLRNSLPNAPPFGALIDGTVTVWVVGALITSMMLYIVGWWQHLRPHPPMKTTPDESSPTQL
jgi:hypothetical protein